MPTIIDGRLDRLRSRRLGLDRLGRLSDDERTNVISRSTLKEAWQGRASSQPNTRYALGAMQAVDPNSTRISHEEAERVGKQLENGLRRDGNPVHFRLQGSVPLDVHIRGVSDVDLLTLDDDFFLFDTLGARANFYTRSTKTSLGVLSNIRTLAEKTLKSAFPAATVDCSGGKAISVSGGSLRRPVDVVPSHWHNSQAYQATGQEHERGVYILNKKVPTTIHNQPFLHIHRVTERDQLAAGGLKRAIRLLKNVKNDLGEEESREIKLPSFDIAALLYHADLAVLRQNRVYELAPVYETQRFLDWCYHHKDEAQRLMTPDGARRVLDTDEKVSAVTSLSVAMDKLAADVAREQLRLHSDATPTAQQLARALNEMVAPAG